MADYTNAEILNEVSRIFRARIDPGKEGGTLNTKVEYAQLLDSASLTLLLNNDAVFYVARLARNSLLSLSLQEIRLLEDILLSLDYLRQIGAPVRDTTILSNANTVLLSLDAADSVENRPEAQRFSRQMDRFTSLYRKNVVSQTSPRIARPREEARGVIKKDLDRLKKVHGKLLDSIYALQGLLDEYLSLDIPSRVSAATLTNIRTNLSEIENRISGDPDAANIAESRQNVLTALASKVVVDSISGFSDPRTVKVRSPTNPLPANLKHFGRVTGTGVAASVVSTQGPWLLPLSAPLVLSVGGGASVQVDVDELLGSGLRAQAKEPFLLATGADKLHVLVDPRTFGGVTGAGTTSTATLASFLGLTYKNLGTPISFPGLTANPTDLSPRVILDLLLLQTGTITSAVSLGGERWRMVFSGWAPGAEAGTGLTQSHVGAYFKDTAPSDRWEILVVESANSAIVSVPTLDPTTITPPLAGGIELRGDSSAGSTVLTFTPATVTAAAATQYTIPASIKTVTLSPSPDNDVAGVIVSSQKEQGDIDTGLASKVWRQMTLNQHVQIKADPANPTRLIFIPRSQSSSYLVVGFQFVKVTAALAVSFVGDSAHSQLGLTVGQGMTDQRLSPTDLVELVEAEVPGLTGRVDRQVIAEGTLSTVQSTSEVVAAELTGVVEVGDQLILRGTALGAFSVESLSPITLDRPVFQSTENNVPYQLIRTKAVLASTSSSRGSSLEVVSGPAELGFPVVLVYSSISNFEAADKSGNLMSFDGLVQNGDVLDLAGFTEVAIDNVNGTTLTLVSGLPSNTEKKAFEVRSSSSLQYSGLVDLLATFTTSSQLLRKYGFDVDLDALDVALTRALLPGQNFAANRNQASRITADLLSILTSNPRQAGEYTTNVPTASLDLESILLPFTPSTVSVVDSLIDSFLERKYTRAVKLLQTGKIREFFETNEETGSYSGALMQASRQVIRDLPAQPTTDEEVDSGVNLAVSTTEGIDSEYNLEDSEVISGGRRR